MEQTVRWSACKINTLMTSNQRDIKSKSLEKKILESQNQVPTSPPPFNLSSFFFLQLFLFSTSFVYHQQNVQEVNLLCLRNMQVLQLVAPFIPLSKQWVDYQFSFILKLPLVVQHELRSKSKRRLVPIRWLNAWFIVRITGINKEGCKSHFH